jgi:hypothetical protein
MTFIEFLQNLSKVQKPAMAKLAPGPLSVNINDHDGIAASLLLWLHDELPDDATFDDMDEIIDAAKWWLTLFASTPLDQEIIDEREKSDG